MFPVMELIKGELFPFLSRNTFYMDKSQNGQVKGGGNNE